MKDYYKMLSVDYTASPETIRKAYYRMAVKFHPDKNIDRQIEAHEKFKEIVEAYEVLSDSSRRLEYDCLLTRFRLRSTLNNLSRSLTSAERENGRRAPHKATQGNCNERQGSSTFHGHGADSHSAEKLFSHETVIEHDVEISLDKMFYGGAHVFYYCPNSNIKSSQSSDCILQGMIFVKPGCLPDTKTTAFFTNEPPLFMRGQKFIAVIRQKPHPYFQRYNENLEVIISCSLQRLYSCTHMSLTGPDGATVKVPTPSLSDFRSEKHSKSLVERWVTLANTGMPILGNQSKRGLLFVKFLIQL